MSVNKRKIFAVLLAAVFCIISLPAERTAAKETDTSSIDWLVQKGILNNEFDRKTIQKNPNKVITRQEYIALIMLAINEKGTNKQFQALNYTDKGQIKKSYQKYYAKYESYSPLKKSDDKKIYLKPKAPLTRQVMAFYLAGITSSRIDLELEEFEDFNEIPASLQPCVSGLVRVGIMSGKTKTRFAPTEYMTWEETACLIKSVIETDFLSKIQVKLVNGPNNSSLPLNGPTGLITDKSKEVIYVADTLNNLIKKIEKGKISILAGKVVERNEWNEGVKGYFDGKAEEALFNKPTGICITDNGLLITDTGNHTIRLIHTAADKVTTFVGTGKAGMKNGERKSAMFNEPKGITVSPDGTIYVADSGNHCIRQIKKDGTISTFAGNAGKNGYKDGSSEEAQFNSPSGIFCDGKNLYVADTGNQRIRMIKDGVVSTIAGGGTERDEVTGDILGDYRDGFAHSARFDGPVNLVMDSTGTIYVSDEGNAMIRVIKDGKVSTIAGIGGIKENGKVWKNYLASPSGLVLSKNGDYLYVSDTFYHTVSKIKIKE